MSNDPGGTVQAAASAAHAVNYSNGLGWSDVVALVGAAAWLPQLWRFFQRPKVTPIAGGQVEIGFSNLGPIFNPKVAFRVERREALVTAIECQITHEKGQKTQFKCMQLIEQGVRSESTSGEKAVHQRQQDVVALVLNPMSIVERKVACQEVTCLERLENLKIQLYGTVDRLRDASAVWIDNVIRSSDYTIISKFLQDSFIWQAGTYRVDCSVWVGGQKHRAKCQFRFVLGDTSIVLLRKNFEIIADDFKRGLTPTDPNEPKPQGLNWVYANVLVSANP